VDSTSGVSVEGVTSGRPLSAPWRALSVTASTAHQGTERGRDVDHDTAHLVAPGSLAVCFLDARVAVVTQVGAQGGNLWAHRAGASG
jgi:hypothetical protein